MHLLHARHAEGEDGEHLGLAPLEQAGAVRGRDDADLGRQRADVGGAAAVDAHALVDDAAAHDLLLQRAERRLDLLGTRPANCRGSSARAARVASSSPSRISSRRSLRSVLSAMAIASRRARAWPARRPRRTRRPRSRCGSRTGSSAIGPRAAMTAARSSCWRSIDAPIHCLASSRPSAMTSSVDLRRALLVEPPGGLGAAGLDHHDGDVAAVDHATGDDELERRLGRPPRTSGARSTRCPWRDRRTAPIGPSNGMPDTMSAADAPLIDATSCGFSRSAPMIVAMTCTSLRKPSGNDGRSGRSVSRQVRIAGSPGRPSRRKNDAGDLPGGVHALLDVDREREEVDALTGLAGDDGAQHGGVADAARAPRRRPGARACRSRGTCPVRPR